MGTDDGGSVGAEEASAPIGQFSPIIHSLRISTYARTHPFSHPDRPAVADRLGHTTPDHGAIGERCACLGVRSICSERTTTKRRRPTRVVSRHQFIDLRPSQAAGLACFGDRARQAIGKGHRGRSGRIATLSTAKRRGRDRAVADRYAYRGCAAPCWTTDRYMHRDVPVEADRVVRLDAPRRQPEMRANRLRLVKLPRLGVKRSTAHPVWQPTQMVKKKAASGVAMAGLHEPRGPMVTWRLATRSTSTTGIAVGAIGWVRTWDDRARYANNLTMTRFSCDALAEIISAVFAFDGTAPAISPVLRGAKHHTVRHQLPGTTAGQRDVISHQRAGMRRISGSVATAQPPRGNPKRLELRECLAHRPPAALGKYRGAPARPTAELDRWWRRFPSPCPSLAKRVRRAFSNRTSP